MTARDRLTVRLNEGGLQWLDRRAQAYGLTRTHVLRAVLKVAADDAATLRKVEEKLASWADVVAPVNAAVVTTPKPRRAPAPPAVGQAPVVAYAGDPDEDLHVDFDPLADPWAGQDTDIA